MPKNNKPELHLGEKYNRLTIINFHHSDKRWKKWYSVKCDCGNEKVIMGSAMTSGNTKSCGCLSLEVKKAKLLPNNLGVIRQIILGYKRHAKRRGFKFLLSESEVIKLISKNCYYCDFPPSNNKITKNHPGFIYSGIDRYDSNKDYTLTNCVPCCDQCNRAKSNLTIEQFKEWIKRLNKTMTEQWSRYLINK